MALGIGIIGAGRIVRHGHLPAYLKAGLNVVGLADIDPSAVDFVRRQWELPLVTTDVDEVINSPHVDVVDVAVPPQYHRELTEKALRAGKHVLCQKPFTLTLKDAEALVALADRLKRKLAVNMNSRWTPVSQCIAKCLEDGYIGAPHLVQVEYHAQLSYEPWRATLPHMIFVEAMIHQFDLLRFWFGMPMAVYAQETLSASQTDKAITLGTVAFRFPRGLIGTVVSDWINPGNESSYKIRVDGSIGSIQASGTAVRVYSQKLPLPGWFEPVVGGEWYPGVGYLPAFASSMKSLLDAIESNMEPVTSGKDNLLTLRLTFEVSRSAEEGEVIRM